MSFEVRRGEVLGRNGADRKPMEETKEQSCLSGRASLRVWRSMRRLPSRSTAKHAVDADIFVDVRPVNAFAYTDDFKSAALLGCSVGQAPRPSNRDTYRATVT